MKAFLWLLLGLLPQLSPADEAYSVELPECHARLERRLVEPELVQVRSDCPLSLKSLAKLLDEGLQGLFPKNRIGIGTIHLGRLMNYPEWSEALANAASRSPSWDSRRGKPRGPNENANFQVSRLLNGPAYPDELKPVFARYGLVGCIAYVEKVLVFEARESMPEDRIPADNVKPNARLPFDAQLWLTLQPLPFDCTKR